MKESIILPGDHAISCCRHSYNSDCISFRRGVRQCLSRSDHVTRLRYVRSLLHPVSWMFVLSLNSLDTSSMTCSCVFTYFQVSAGHRCPDCIVKPLQDFTGLLTFIKQVEVSPKL